MPSTPASERILPFESASELREAHARLLEALDTQLESDSSVEGEAAALAGMETELRQFLERGAATGVYLEEVKQRTACQVLMDYWVASLSQAGLQVASHRLARFDGAQLPDLKDRACPYVGLEAFRDRAFFFGREADTQVLLTQLHDMPLVVVLGASGSGKSSLVMGGVLPALAAEERRPTLCIVPPFVPGDTVLVSLADAVLHGHSGSDLAAEVAALREDPGHLGAMVGGVEARPTLIAIDQFEEVFTLSDPADREALVANLVQLLEAGLGHRVILTVREEFRSRIVELRALSPFLKAAWYSMRPMGYEELRAAVEGPAALVNLQFQSGIVDDLVKKVLGQPAALPLLQFALRSLWEKRDRNRITWEVYRAVGDPLTALQNAADTFYNSLALQTQSEVRRILLELVRVDELLEAYRQPVRKNTLLEVGKANTQEVLDLLAAHEFVRIAHGSTESEAIVEIRHESLIRNWPRFVGWIDDKRRDRRQRFALTQAADQWDKGRRPREGLLTGWQLQQAAEQSDLSILEREFVEASARAIRRLQRRKERKLIAGLALALVAVVWAFDRFYLEEWRLTWGELHSLERPAFLGMDRIARAEAETRLDNIAFHLWEERGPHPNSKSLDTLVQILKSANSWGLFKNDTYKVADWNATEYSTSSMRSTQDTNTIVTLEYPKNAVLSAPLLEFFWREISKEAWGDGFPIPANVTVKARDDDESLYRFKVKRLELSRTPTDNLRGSNAVSAKAHRNKILSGRIPGANVRGQSIASSESKPAETFLEKSDNRDLNFTFDPSEVLLDDYNLDPDAKALLEKYKIEWNVRPLFTGPIRSRWSWVPRWTIPIWKAAGAKQFYPPEVGAIILAILQIMKEPDVLYSDGFVAGVLHFQASRTPATITAACKASGGIDTLVNKTKAWIEIPKQLPRLENLLESLARDTARPAIPSGDECNVAHLWDSVSQRIETAYFSQELDAAMNGAYRPEPPLHIYLASNLQAFIAPGWVFDPVVKSRLDQQVRQNIQNALGFRLPTFLFDVNPDLAENQFTIEIHGQSPAAPLLASPGHEVDDILEGLHKSLLLARATWLDTEETAHLTNGLPPALQEWLSKNYSDGQLGMILREVLRKGGSQDPRLEADTASEQHQESATLSHFSWLVRSLAFWKQVCRDADIQCLGDGLRSTELARSSRQSDTAHSIHPVTTYPGIGALVAGRLDEAAVDFAQRMRTSDPASESRAFVEAYSRTALQFDSAMLEQDCMPEIGNYASNENRVGENFLLERVSTLLDKYGQSLTGSMRARLELCQISSLLPRTSEKARVRNLIDRQFESNSMQWTSNEKAWLSYLALRNHLDSDESKDKAPPRHLEEIRSLLSEAIGDLPTKKADSVYYELSDLCNKPSSGYWCMKIFNDWPKLKSDSYWIPFDLAITTNGLGREDARAALQSVDQAERNLSTVDRNKQQQQRAWMTYIRGSAHETLAELGVDGELDTAIRYLTGLTPIFRALQPDAVPDWSNLIERSTSALAEALRDKENFDEASKVISQGHALVKKESDWFVREDVTVLWDQGKFTEAIALVERKPVEGWLFDRCASKIFADTPSAAIGLETDVDDFLRTSDGYRDYVRLLYFWHLMRNGNEVEAAKLLRSRWMEINPADLPEPPSWKLRLQAERGDYLAVWQEMLVGYFLGKVSQQRMTAGLLDTSRNFDDSAFGRSSESRQGFLTEWYFYDALLQSVTGDRSRRVDRFRSGLEKAVNMKQFGFSEYKFAKSLLSRIERGEDLTRQAHSR
jgi:hypothetical protein